MLGRKIKDYLDEKGIKYTYISEKTGLGMNIISPLLNGKREIKATEYFSICAALDLPLEYFADQEQLKVEKEETRV